MQSFYNSNKHIQNQLRSHRLQVNTRKGFHSTLQCSFEIFQWHRNGYKYLCYKISFLPWNEDLPPTWREFTSWSIDRSLDWNYARPVVSSVVSQAYHSDCSVIGPINQFICDYFTLPVTCRSWAKLCERRSILYRTLTENIFYGVTVCPFEGVSYHRALTQCVCVTVVNVLDLPFASPIPIYR